MNELSASLSRRRVLASGLAIAGAGTLGAFAQSKPTRPPAIDAATVREFVIAGHGNLEKTKSMLEKEPGLLNACWDWGGGDFETALEGAGHTGHREIAEFLISKGSRMNHFCAAMLGQLETLKSILNANPGLRTAKGPHGITLARHAEMGGEPAKRVLEYLRVEGLA